MKKINLNKILRKINKLTRDNVFEIGIVVGSGIDLSSIVENPIVVSYKDLGMPTGKVIGHNGSFIFGEIQGKSVVLASRYHYYESWNMEYIKLPYEILKKLGVKTVIMQSSSAGINSNYKIGDIVNIIDHINFTGFNPLCSFKELKFVNMSNAYDKDLIGLAEKEYASLNLSYKQGTHIQFLGPNYETMAEINMAKKFGADTISMSLVYDNLICVYLGIKVLAFAVVTNIANVKNIKTLSHTEVLENCKKANENYIMLIKNVIKNL